MMGSHLLLVVLLAGSLLLDGPHHHGAAASESPAFSFSFDFSSSSLYNSQDLKMEGDASMHGSYIDLTCNTMSQDTSNCTAGRMSYKHPVPFYDNTTGEVASFRTRFTFLITQYNTKGKGDGMAFFLASYPSTLPPSSEGGNLGLIKGNDEYMTVGMGADRFVAVEFDTFKNHWENDTADHIGIDISSVRQRFNTTWSPFGLVNRTMTASIEFVNTTRMLIATLQFDDHDQNPNKSTPIEVSMQLPDPVSCLLPSEVAVGFSGATGAYFELHQIMSWSFNSTLAAPHIVSPKQNGSILSCPDARWSKQCGEDEKMVAIVQGSLIAGSAVVLVLSVWSILSWWKWTRISRSFDKRTGGVRRFQYHDLAAATRNFSEENNLGAGSFGEVYKGFLKELSREVAVKKIMKECRKEHLDFFAEVQTISRAKHKNLVELLGWSRVLTWNIIDFLCWCRKKNSTSQLLLVYELVSNGNLHEHLHEREEVLPWSIRFKIVKDIGSALLYLHHDSDPYILHRDIKPSNILLDDNFCAKLADFQLSRTAENGTIITKWVVGTTRYLDPQCTKTGRFNRSSDVYSFGVVLLEIACREGDNSFEQVWPRYINKSLMQAADDKLEGEFDAVQMERVIVLGLWCCVRDAAQRPTMRQAMDFLEHDKPFPQLALMMSSTTSVSANPEPSFSITACA